MSIVLPSLKQSTRQLPIQTAAIPARVILPLDQHHGQALTPCVVAGERVSEGQLIATPDTPLGAHLHASISGVIECIEPRPTMTGLSRCIVIRHEGNPQRFVHEPCNTWASLSQQLISEQLARGGIAGLGGAVFPTGLKLAGHTHRIDTLIINGMECEPCITCDERLMQERAPDIIHGIQILLHATQAQQALIAIEQDKPEAIAAMRQAILDVTSDTSTSRLAVYVLPTEYPGGDEGQLIHHLLQREIPRGGLPADVGVIVHNVGTAYACARWLLHGDPLISRIVTITSADTTSANTTASTAALPDNRTELGNVEVRIGTPVHALLTQPAAPSRRLIIMGGPMMGKAVPQPEIPLTKGSNCLIIAPDSWHHNTPEQPCIRCGECMHACPVNLLPQQLLWHARPSNQLQPNQQALQELGLQDCIECGCCDYVCPSQITLAARFRAAKLQST